MSTQVPLKRTLSVLIAAAATNADLSTVLGKVPFAGVISGVEFIPNAAITGQDTNTRRHAITNRGTDGLGTTEGAFLQWNNGVNGVAFDAKTITLHATVANRNVAAGDILTVDSTTPGTGLADPGGLFVVEITRDDGDA